MDIFRGCNTLGVLGKGDCCFIDITELFCVVSGGGPDEYHFLGVSFIDVQQLPQLTK